MAIVPVGVDERAERLDDPHRAQRVGDHEPGELLGGDIGDAHKRCTAPSPPMGGDSIGSVGSEMA